MFGGKKKKKRKYMKQIFILVLLLRHVQPLFINYVFVNFRYVKKHKI